MYIDMCKCCWFIDTEVISLNDIIICHDMIYHYTIMNDALFLLMTVKTIVKNMLIPMYKT